MFVFDTNYGRGLNQQIEGTSFYYGDFVSSELALRNKIKNVPSETQWKNIELLAQTVLQPINDGFGEIEIVSGFWNQNLSRLTGEINETKIKSHSMGLGVDIKPIDKQLGLTDLVGLIEYCFLSSLEEVSCKLIQAEYLPGGWIHVSLLEDFVGISNENTKTLRLKTTNPKMDFKRVSLERLKQELLGN